MVEGRCFVLALFVCLALAAVDTDLAHIAERLEAAEQELAVLRKECGTQASEPLVLAGPSITLATPEVNVPGEIRFSDNSTLASARTSGSVVGTGYLLCGRLTYPDPDTNNYGAFWLGCYTTGEASCEGECSDQFTTPVNSTCYSSPACYGTFCYAYTIPECCLSIAAGGCTATCPNGTNFVWTGMSAQLEGGTTRAVSGQTSYAVATAMNFLCIQ